MSYAMTYGSDTVLVELGQPEMQIKVDGEDIGRQVADGSCRTEDCMRLAAVHCWGSDVDWDAVSYESTAPLVEYARQTAADMGEDFAAAVRAMRDEAGEVARETGVTADIVRVWCAAQAG